MKFVGTALTEGFVRGPIINQDIVSPAELTIIVNEDGSIDSTIVLGEEDPVIESWPPDPDAFRLVEFNGMYFLDKALYGEEEDEEEESKGANEEDPRKDQKEDVQEETETEDDR